MLSLLTIFEQVCSSSFKVRRIEDYKLNNVDNESSFQLVNATKKNQLISSTLCILIGTNTRYEGSHLNLNLRQRYLKGNFSLISLGSYIDLTIPLRFLGSNIKILKSLTEGNNLFCLDLAASKNPLLVYNSEFSRRHDSDTIISMFKILKYSNLITKTWNGVNVLNASMNDVGVNLLTKFLPLSDRDLDNFKGIYLLNYQMPLSIPNLKKLMDLKLLNSNWIKTDNSTFLSHKIFFNKTSSQNYYFNLPSNVFFEDNETFVNARGFIKRVPKLISSASNSKGNWQILRKFFLNFNNLKFINNTKETNYIFFNCKNQRRLI